ncbi:unnamed protein product, partial [Hapterophycus canaliculatus]
MALPTQPNDGCPGPRSEDSAGSSRVQRVPSFKLLDDDRARSKRFRNRVPSAVGRCDVEGGDVEMPMPSPLTESARTSPHLAAPGPRRVSSFNLTSDVFRMSHTSSWGSGVGGNIFGLGPASVDGEGEDIVQRLDDAGFNDLNFLTMEGVGPSDISAKALGEQSGAGIDMKADEKRATAGGRSFDRTAAGAGYSSGGNGCDRPQATVSKEEMTANPIVDRTCSARDILSRANSVRDLLRSGSMSRGESNHDVFGTNQFDLDEGPPIFSSSMEDYLNHQLEAAEQSLDSSAVAERSGSNIADRAGGPDDGNDGEVNSSSLGDVREGGSAPGPTSTRPAEVKSERDRYICDPDGIRRIRACSQSVQVKAEELRSNTTEKRSKFESLSQPQHRQRRESDEEAESSHSEYEPPPPRKKKSKKRRGRERVGTAAATAAAAAAAAAATSTPLGKASGGAAGARAASSVSTTLRRSTPKRQTSEDVAARLPLEVLESFYHVPLNVAAVQLDVSLTMLKKLCRAYGVKRWPHRQVSSLDKTTLKLEEKIKARSDGGKEAPSLVRKLTQAKKRRSVIIKTASAGLDANVLNSIFTSRPGAIDEDLLLSSTNVAEAVGKIHSALEIDHRNSESESEAESDDGSDGSSCSSSCSGSCSGSGSDHYPDEHAGRCSSSAGKPSPSTPKNTPDIHTAFATLPSFSKSPTGAKSVSAPPPAFEPGGRPKNFATKDVTTKKGDVPRAMINPSVALRKASARNGKKTDRATASTTRTRKVPVSTGDARKFVAARSASGRDRSTPPTPKTAAAAAAAAAAVAAAAAAAAVLPSSYTCEGPGFDGCVGHGMTSKAGGSGADSAASPFGNTPRRRAQTIGYSGSGVFGMGLHHQNSRLFDGRSASTMLSGAARAARSSRRALDPSQPRATTGIPRVLQQATRTTAQVEGAGKSASEDGEWRGGASSTQSSSSQQHLTHAGPESPTTAGALDGFDLKLNLESPSRAPHTA